VIQLVGVSKRFGHKLLFDELSWHIRRGERIGLVGPNGCGKTTLLRILSGGAESDEGQVVRSKGVAVGLLDQEQDFSGDRTVLEEVRRASTEMQELEARIAEIEARLDEHRPGDLETYGELQTRFEARGGYMAETEARRVLCGLGFTDEELSHAASRFSGGWRMRISLARLLLVKPDVLLLDEPTNHLDLESIAWLETHLAAYEGAVITVSHDRYYLNRACKHIAELTTGGVRIYTGDYDTFLEQREKDRELLIKRHGLQQKEIAKTEKFIERFRYKNTKAAAVQSRVKALDKLERIELPQSTREMRGFKFPQPGRSGRFVAELKDVRMAYGDNVVYDGLTLDIERGRKIALVGVNGAGKSTLLKILAEEAEISGGERKLGHNVNYGYFGQHQLEDLQVDLTVMQEMEGVADIQTYPLVRGILGAFLFSGDDVSKPVGVLSGGEKARLALCKLLLRPVTLMLMDEPTSHLDLQSRASLEDALARYTGTMVVVSHDRYFINEVCTHVLEVERGAVRWYPGNYDDYLWKKAQESEGEDAAQAQVVRTSGGLKGQAEVARPVDDERARKRQQAEERQRVYKATRALKKDLEAVQTRIEETEARMAAIDEELSQPEAYQAGGPGPQLLLERAGLETKLAADYEVWEQLEMAIEEATEQAKT